MNGDGRQDVVAVYWCAYSFPGQDYTGPVPNTLLVYLSQPDGTYVIGNRRLFGTDTVDIGGYSNGFTVSDFNGDGRPDVGISASKEDMRARGSAGLMNWVTPQVVLLSKAESLDALAWLAQAAPQAALVPIVESAQGVESARVLASAPGVHRLAFGTLDFALDMQMSVDESGDQSELATFRTQLALASRLAGIAPPIDGVTTVFDDEPRVLRDTLRARRFGFGAKLCIHPRQVLAVHNAFAPTPAELDWAQRVIEAHRAAAGNAVQVDGSMVDLPVLLQAEALLARRP
jgi:citrate lyase subunit beta/citryl-CoA lyase